MRHTLLKKGLKGAIVLGGLCVLIPSVYSQGIGLKKLDEMLTPTPTKLERGKVIYQRQCVTCHGDQGTNDTEWAKSNGLAAGGFKAGWEHGGGVIQIYNTISQKQDDLQHPVFNYVAYQDRWAVSHYVRSFNPNQTDPAAVKEQARVDAVNGVCREELKTQISESMKPKGEEQLTKGKEVYATNCASCHGEAGKGDGAAAAALNPAPRNFTKADAKWTNGSSELAIFNTLANGIEGTSMASYKHLTEEERWALTHYVRNWVPEKAKESSTDEQVVAVCRSLSAPKKPEAIPVEMAMKFLAEDAPAKRQLTRQGYGAVYTYNDANADKGSKIYTDHCAACHGSRGEGAQPIGPYGAVPPFLYLTVAPLSNNDAGGSYDTFATRVAGGVHATLPDMTGVALISESEWKDLHAYVGKFDGDAEYIAADIAEMRNKPALELAIEVKADQTMTLDGQAVTMEELGQRVAETTKSGRRVNLKVVAPATFTPEQVKTLGESLGAVGATDIEVSAQPAPAPAPQPAPEGAKEQPGDQGNAPSANP